MPAYVIVETDIHDPEQYEQYKAASPAAVAGGGGRFVVRGGELAVLEGDWEPTRLVVLEFEDLEAVKRWYDSPEYQAAKKLRDGAANLRMVAVQGVVKRPSCSAGGTAPTSASSGSATAIGSSERPRSSGRRAKSTSRIFSIAGV